MWWKQNKNRLMLVALLFLVALIAVGLWRSSGGAGVREKLQGMVAIVTAPVGQVVRNISDGAKGIVQYKDIRRENRRLEEEVSALQQEKQKLALQKEEYAQLQYLSRMFHRKDTEELTLQAANVIATDSTLWMKVFTVDRGRDSRIATGAVVVSGDGLVGKVSQVTANSAKVVSLLDGGSKIGFQVKGKKKAMGIVQGNGKGGLSGYLLDGSSALQKGDVLTTSGLGAYPQGFPIGRVIQVEKHQGDKAMVFTGVTAVDFLALRKVAVIL